MTIILAEIQKWKRNKIVLVYSDPTSAAGRFGGRTGLQYRKKQSGDGSF